MAHDTIQGSLDTNALVRYVLDDVPEHTQALTRLFKRGGRFLIEDLALVEMVFVLEKVYKLPRNVVVDNVLFFLHHPQCECSVRLFEETIPLYTTHSKLSFIDCLLLVSAKQKGATPLFTFDKALVSVGGENAQNIL